MNKYTIITLVILTGVLLPVLNLFDIEYKWWHFIPVYFVGNYIGKVIQSTFKGFNINNISFTEIKDETTQVFICSVVLGFTGKSIEFKGEFDKSIEIPINDLRILLYKSTNRNEVRNSLELGNPFSKKYKYRTNDIEVVFTEITRYINN
ncbi:hypothetical protein [Psychroserpens sp.]